MALVPHGLWSSVHVFGVLLVAMVRPFSQPPPQSFPALWCARWHEAVLRPSAQEPHPARPLYNSRASWGLEPEAPQRALWPPWAVGSPQFFPGLLLAFIQAERGCFSETPTKCVSMALIFISLKFIFTPVTFNLVLGRTTCFMSSRNFPESVVYGINFESLALILGFGNPESIFSQSFCLCHEPQKSILIIRFLTLSCSPLKGSKHIS